MATTTPRWYRTPRLPGYTRLPAPPTVRRETPEKYVARLTKMLGKAREKANYVRANEAVGGGAAFWRIAETDGARALLVPGEPSRPMPVRALSQWPVQQIVLQPEFYLVVVRVLTAGTHLRLTLQPDRAEGEGGLLLSTTSPDDPGTSAREPYDGLGAQLTYCDVTVDGKLLLDGLGLWPAVLRIGGPSDPVWVCTEATRYVLMPLRPHGDVKAAYTVEAEDWVMKAEASALARARED